MTCLSLVAANAATGSRKKKVNITSEGCYWGVKKQRFTHRSQCSSRPFGATLPPPGHFVLIFSVEASSTFFRNP